MRHGATPPVWVNVLALCERWGCPPSVALNENAVWITRQAALDKARNDKAPPANQGWDDHEGT